MALRALRGLAARPLLPPLGPVLRSGGLAAPTAPVLLPLGPVLRSGGLAAPTAPVLLPLGPVLRSGGLAAPTAPGLIPLGPVLRSGGLPPQTAPGLLPLGPVLRSGGLAKSTAQILLPLGSVRRSGGLLPPTGLSRGSAIHQSQYSSLFGCRALRCSKVQMALPDRGRCALSQACALTLPGSLLRAPVAPLPQTALSSLLRARALPTIQHRSKYTAVPKEAHNATGGTEGFPFGGSGWGYGVTVTAATVSALIASVLEPEIAECQDDEILPDRIDWTEAGAVTSVKDQGECNNCWAFSTVGSIEALHKIKNGVLLELSVQQVTDCAYGCSGCLGGWSIHALMYEVSAGVSLASTYPRRQDGWDGTCRSDLIKPAVIIAGFARTDFSEEDLRRAVAKQPVVVVLQIAVDNDYIMEHYKGGVIEYRDLPTVFGPHVLHSVLVVGYGVDELTGVPYWKIKNSMGPTWGENGYFRIRRNVPDGLGTGGIRGRPGYYPLFEYDENDKKSYTSLYKTHMDVIMEKQFDPTN